MVGGKLAYLSCGEGEALRHCRDAHALILMQPHKGGSKLHEVGKLDGRCIGEELP